MRLIKRLWYRLWLWNATESAAEVFEQYGKIPDSRWLSAIDYWAVRIEKWQSRIDALDALDAPDDDSEQLSKRAIPAPMYWHK